MKVVISQQHNSNLQFLKLGGSLITDKDQPQKAHLDIIEGIAGEIKSAINQPNSSRLIVGHGSGSFGHIPAKEHKTRDGVSSPEEWRGFVDVWRQAYALNRIVVDAFIKAGLPAITFPPSACVLTQNHQVLSWNIEPLQKSLKAGLLPVVYGDVVFDQTIGGTILSTEELFGYLAKTLLPSRVLLAGLEPGVWLDFPDCTEIIKEITPHNWDAIKARIGGSASIDVTGGMYSKVFQSYQLAQDIPNLEVMIFSGQEPGIVERALLGYRFGTLISS